MRGVRSRRAAGSAYSSNRNALPMVAESKLHVLVMTAEWQSALACIQSFGRKGHTVSIVAGGAPHPNHASIFVKNAVSLVEKGLDERVHELMEVVHRNAIDLVVPISDHDAILVAKARQSFPETRALIGGPLESVLVAGRRNNTTALCRSLQVDTPKTIFATHDTAVTAVRELGYPCFLKLSGTFSSLGVFEISSDAELDARLKPVPSHVEMQLQAKIEGDLIGITGFALDGNVLESFAFRCDYIHSRAGTPAYASRVRDDRPLQILSTIATALRWTGGIDLDLLETRDGSLALLEINPRFSGTTVFALKVGIDPSHPLRQRPIGYRAERDVYTQSSRCRPFCLLVGGGVLSKGFGRDRPARI